MFLVISVLKVNQQGAVLKVDEVEFVNQLIFADRLSIFPAFFFCDSAGNRVDVTFFSYTDLGVNIGFPGGMRLMGISAFNKWLDGLWLFFGGFHFLNHARTRKSVNGASLDSAYVALSLTELIQSGASHGLTNFWGHTLVILYPRITCEPVTY